MCRLFCDLKFLYKKFWSHEKLRGSKVEFFQFRRGHVRGTWPPLSFFFSRRLFFFLSSAIFSSFLASFLLLPARPPEHHRSSISCYFLCSSSPLPLLPLQPRAASAAAAVVAAENRSFRWSAGQLELAGTPTLRWFQAVQSGGKGLNSMVEPSISLILAWIIESQFWCSWAKMIKLA